MGYVRSCYEAECRFYQDRPADRIIFYFVPETNPYFTRENVFWPQKEFTQYTVAGDVGERVDLPRPWRRGDGPTWLDGTPRGSDADFRGEGVYSDSAAPTCEAIADAFRLAGAVAGLREEPPDPTAVGGPSGAVAGAKFVHSLFDGGVVAGLTVVPVDALVERGGSVAGGYLQQAESPNVGVVVGCYVPSQNPAIGGAVAGLYSAPLPFHRGGAVVGAYTVDWYAGVLVGAYAPNPGPHLLGVLCGAYAPSQDGQPGGVVAGVYCPSQDPNLGGIVAGVYAPSQDAQRAGATSGAHYVGLVEYFAGAVAGAYAASQALLRGGVVAGIYAPSQSGQKGGSVAGAMSPSQDGRRGGAVAGGYASSPAPSLPQRGGVLSGAYTSSPAPTVPMRGGAISGAYTSSPTPTGPMRGGAVVGAYTSSPAPTGPMRGGAVAGARNPGGSTPPTPPGNVLRWTGTNFGNGGCGDCTTLNQTRRMIHTGGVWYGQFGFWMCGGVWTHRFEIAEFEPIGKPCYLYLYEWNSGLNRAVYTATWQGTVPITLTLDGGSASGQCQWQETIVVENDS